MGRPSIYLSVVMTIWGAISTATGAVQSFGGLVAVRVLLGVVESAFFPGALMILSSWYDKNTCLQKLYFIRWAVNWFCIQWFDCCWYIENGWLGWCSRLRYLFIIEGGITVLTVPFAYFILPDNPSNTKFLSQEEKTLLCGK